MGVLTFQMTRLHSLSSEQVHNATIFVQVDFGVLEKVAGPIVGGRALETIFKHIRPTLERLARSKMDGSGESAAEPIRITLCDLNDPSPPVVGLVGHAPHSGPSSFG